MKLYNESTVKKICTYYLLLILGNSAWEIIKGIFSLFAEFDKNVLQ